MLLTPLRPEFTFEPPSPRNRSLIHRFHDMLIANVGRAHIQKGRCLAIICPGDHYTAAKPQYALSFFPLNGIDRELMKGLRIPVELLDYIRFDVEHYSMDEEFPLVVSGCDPNQVYTYLTVSYTVTLAGER